MPMVTESSIPPARAFSVRKAGGSTTLFNLPDGRHRSQTGFRSRELTPEELLSFRKNSLSGNVVSLISAYDDLERDIPSIRAYRDHRARAWPVNDRDYVETTYKPTGFQTDCTYLAYSSGKWNPVRYVDQGALGISSLSSTAMPSMPSDSETASLAARMLRNSRPPKAGFDLARFAGEQREAGLLFKASNYMPRSRSELGGAYLNWLFGIKPTGSDLGKLAELVLRSDNGVQRLLDAEKVREKKYGTKVLLSDSGGGTVTFTTSDATSTGATFSVGLGTCKYVYLSHFSTSGNYGNVVIPILRYSYTRKQSVRTFATWEYFVPQPLEIRGRLASYRKKAQEVLSAGKLNESTVWELTPWTWLSDWFVDIGGLLRYQRDVVDNQIVATSCGYSTWEEYTILVHYAERARSGNVGIYPYYGIQADMPVGVQASVRWRRHKRRGGNPYSISPTWSLTTQQWGILGALGLSRGAGIPTKRS